MNTSLIATAAVLLAMTSIPVMAQQDSASTPVEYPSEGGPQQAYGNVQPGYAEVISSRPDYRQIKINVPGQQVCRDEAVTGAVAANPSQKAAVDQTRCETQYSSHFEQRQVGYDVTYRYGGQIYHTHLVRDPGAQLQVDVTVTPSASAGASY